MINLLIARHGNTFDPGDLVCRVGRGTDIPLSNSGKQQAIDLGGYLTEYHPDIAVVYTSTLQRTVATAQIILKTMGIDRAINPLPIFDEIDYGPDEGKPETEVIARLGEDALENWEKNNLVPQGWNVDPDKIKNTWLAFSNEREKDFPGQTVLVVTSNGIGRFAPGHSVKLKTGAVSYLKVEQGQWHCLYANRRPAVKES
jgi:2,3-bisphosphoglycerate-dependent phosphoglycerate mutase